MPELEVKPEHAADPDTRRVGILVGVVGILLSVVTIASHRAHTHAVIHRTESNDLWSYYQAKKIRENTEEVAMALISILNTVPPGSRPPPTSWRLRAPSTPRTRKRFWRRHSEGRGDRSRGAARPAL